MSATHSFSDTLSYFKNRRLLSVFFFGIASGFPWVMTGSAMSGWLKDEGLSRSSIGLFGLIFVTYSINFLWSPLVDRLKIPFLTVKVGQRRSWILLTQLVIVIATFQLSQVNVVDQLSIVALFGLLIAFAGSSQDIAIDAYRIDILSNDDSNYMTAGSAMATAGWWTGFAGLGSVPFILVDQPNWQWPEVYFVLATMMAVLMITAFVVEEPNNDREQILNAIQNNYLLAMPNQGHRPLAILLILPLIFVSIIYANIGYPAWPVSFISTDYQLILITLFIISLLFIFSQQLSRLNLSIRHDQNSNNISVIRFSHKLTAWLLATLVAPIQEFFDRNGKHLAISILLFIFLFKLGEAYLGRMSIVFYREVGFSNSDIAYYSKMINWATTIVFSLIGSVFTIRYGILKGLFIGGIAMASSNLLFAVMAVVGPDKLLFAFTVFVDGFTSAWGSVAFVALLSVLCNKTFTASQYALMVSLGTFGRVMLGSYSGIIVDWLDGNWALFFVLTAFMVIPSLIFLYSIRKPLTALIEKNDRESKGNVTSQ
ncbi:MULTISPECIES: AmpG family muropeptide MFS transporter [unclassified Colwellia]|uniref:AmpG family muropeptide MFS transporter n=1 Tax=unclassified Colwellia TaxID=196834 RepID=UPI0015F37F0C|nr:MULTISPECIES: MFS transporter permease [unclassified Colwellia]MBA6230813.1 MFS transporter permease [Colwellia sp. MB02u-7]MBA6234744.1 MFS transporter permease [Colwellia sp. MB02u-11]MBA6255607.1 MFS transporter permease [Colwellia sp. MB3u-28]MBA6261748.1 MFS transporter permease [Colwellia sp. MB3u-41]MBA6301299.1 MFS transporter permease [Colwellia sp. MB3u-22]